MYLCTVIFLAIGYFLGLHTPALVQLGIAIVALLLIFTNRVKSTEIGVGIFIMFFVFLVAGMLAGDLYVYIALDNGSIGKLIDAATKVIFTPSNYR